MKSHVNSDLLVNRLCVLSDFELKYILPINPESNAFRYDREARQLRSPRESKVRFHPSSVLLDKEDGGGGGGRRAPIHVPTDWFLFDEMTRAGHLALVRGVTAVAPVTVLIFAGPSR